eukprot:scaffold43506_cov65-Attheya_sp.AAC.1
MYSFSGIWVSVNRVAHSCESVELHPSKTGVTGATADFCCTRLLLLTASGAKADTEEAAAIAATARLKSRTMVVAFT